MQKAKLQVSEMENQLIVPKYVKNKVKEYGNLFIKFCKLQIPSLKNITNTIFKHKPNHQTA